MPHPQTRRPFVESFYVMMLVFLALLAAFDLFVGVSNDAVNFLSPAIGSRVAPFKVIMFVASVGVLAGATFSSGMMEIARKGVFYPQMFSFSDLMIVFFAVMITDVLLLDVFNTLGLPTSTTVSMVFELLGGAVAAALYTIYKNGQSLLTIDQYINSGKALTIISGILISVVVAFIAGVAVQYVVRLIFTFSYKKIYQKVGSIFGGVSITAIFYFLVMKGAKGSSFMDQNLITWIDANTWSILAVTFIFLTLLFHICIRFLKINIFKFIILTGTFALAFAFAGNDLVNFVGVPLAALDSYNHFAANGNNPGMSMECLLTAMRTPTTYLLLAGLIMTLTLWFSKKAHRVVQTTVNLSSSASSEEEQFSSTLPGRLIVRGGLAAGNIVHQLLPSSVLGTLGRRMQKQDHVLDKDGEELPFDELRASINLVVSSILIASATSLKLPLSTTYVTFMVAMGSSFADGAWDRESAVYRVSGVITVIGGWFLTALTAFLACAIVTCAIFAGGQISAIVLMAIASILLIRSNCIVKQNEESSFAIVTNTLEDPKALCLQLNNDANKIINKIVEISNTGLEGLLAEDAKILAGTRKEVGILFDEVDRQRCAYYRMAVSGSMANALADDAHFFHYRVFTNLKEVVSNLQEVIDAGYNHVINNHRVFVGSLRKNLQDMILALKNFQKLTENLNNDISIFRDYFNKSSNKISIYQMELLHQIDPMHLSQRSSDFYLFLLSFGRDALNRFALVVYLQQELARKYAKGKNETRTSSTAMSGKSEETVWPTPPITQIN